MDITVIRVFWVFLSGLLTVAELLSGTFFLLILALGALAGFFSTFFIFSIAIQLFIVMLIALTGLFFLLYIYAQKTCNFISADLKEQITTEAICFDLGKRIFIEKWDDIGNTRARYRGSEWFVRYVTNKQEKTPDTGWFFICGIDGITLLVSDEN